MRSWCLRGSNLTIEKSVLTAHNPHRIVKFISMVSWYWVFTNGGRSQAGRPETMCKDRKTQRPTLKSRQAYSYTHRGVHVCPECRGISQEESCSSFSGDSLYGCCVIWKPTNSLLHLRSPTENLRLTHHTVPSQGSKVRKGL